MVIFQAETSSPLLSSKTRAARQQHIELASQVDILDSKKQYQSSPALELDIPIGRARITSHLTLSLVNLESLRRDLNTAFLDI